MLQSNSNAPPIICLESEAFYHLIDEVIEKIAPKHNLVEQQKWINDAQAMQLLSISSRTTLQKFRDEGKIRFSQPTRKLILYDRDSILEFIEQNAKDTF